MALGKNTAKLRNPISSRAANTGGMSQVSESRNSFLDELGFVEISSLWDCALTLGCDLWPLVNESVDKLLKSRSPERYKIYQAEKELSTKLRQKEHDRRRKEDDLKAKMKGVPLDYRYYSTEDEEVSDYELEADDLHPRNNPNK